MKHFNKLNIKLGLVQGFYWMASCVFVSFFVRLLSSFGYSDYECGIALSISALATLFVQPMLGRLADEMKKVGKLLVLCFLVAIVFALLLLLFHSNRIVTYIFIFIIFGSFRSLIYIIDLWSYATAGEDPSFSYGFTRSFGAVFYALSAFFFGYAIDLFSSKIIIPCFVIMSILALLMVVFSPKESTKVVVKKNEIGLLPAIKILLKNKHYMVLLVSYTLMEMCSIPGQNYLTRKFEVLNSGDIFTGIALLVMGLLQLLPLNNMDKLKKKFSPSILILVSLFGLVSRAFILAFTKTSIGTVLAFLTEPFAFGLYIGAIILYMREYLPGEVYYFGTTLYSAITAGIGGIVGNYVAGKISNSLGIISMLKCMTLPAILSFLIFLIYTLTLKKKNNA